MPWKYLHEDAEGVFHLDHRLAPEVSAMFAAMSSRMPAGGIEARYKQIVEAVAEDLIAQSMSYGGREGETFPVNGTARKRAEDLLCEYPIHPRVQEFFDKFVLKYGHSSIMELTGQPAVYTEGLSWYDAYLLFDSPLCSGQEFSTRAVRHKNWPMARSAKPDPMEQFRCATEPGYGPWIHEQLHSEWFEVFEAEVEWWKTFFSSAENRAAYGIADKEPFRPALDRARWAIPGTISTGCCHTGHLRERARILRDGLLLAQRSGAEEAVKVWENIREGYAAALPGLSGMGLREAVYGADSKIPGHLVVLDEEPGPEVEIEFFPARTFLNPVAFGRSPGEKSYLDPVFNQLGRVDVTFRCSLAVARDWHRHRTMYPWSLDLVRDYGKIYIVKDEQEPPRPSLRIHPRYKAQSDLAKSKLPALLQKSTEAYDEFTRKGNQMQAMLCLPLGTEVALKGQGGLRDVVYMLELRGHAHGANFEYKAQALEALKQLKGQLVEAEFTGGSPLGINILSPMGLV